MAYNQYDFDLFLQTVRDMNYLEILQHAEMEANRAEKASTRVRGAVRARQQGSGQYVAKIGAFLFFMRHGQRPSSASDDEFQSYRPVVEALVAKDQFKPEILNLFR